MIAFLLLTLLLPAKKFTIEKAEAKEDPAINEIIYKLIMCESSYVPDQNIVDSNGVMSYGLLQWQKHSFDYFGEEYGLLHDDIEDSSQQIAVAKQVIAHGLGKQTWTNCYRKLKLN